ncbi:head GIN domain-containing protein [Fulvivirga sediminis]|uniref:DUF2807 domain-containing protein n=1 Tax=Fulvivirga sediminis TaxID=2803949 RepID=A0A937JXR5_9BACT|nr:head GIN domain-containing protein [Fulvivirga sediminis]MBL3654894.1 DUF2807 domain-containing protein [Fulvivirga sediminis]
MKFKLSPFILLYVLLNIVACGSYVEEKGNGKIITKETVLETFKELDLGGNYEVFLRKSDSPKITLTTDENLHEFITFNVKEGVLHVDSEVSMASEEPIRLDVYYTDIQTIRIGGAVSIESLEPVKGDHLWISMSGAGAINLEVNVKDLKVNVSGAGAVQLSGHAEQQNVQLSGAGGYEADELKSVNCKIEISGVGGASVYVEETLNASVSGVGGVSYKGNPESVVSNVSGLGSISKDGEED